jgi:hypothetical protein
MDAPDAIDPDLIHDLFIYLILPSSVMLISYCIGFEHTSFTNLDAAAIISWWFKIYRMFYR